MTFLNFSKSKFIFLHFLKISIKKACTYVVLVVMVRFGLLHFKLENGALCEVFHELFWIIAHCYLRWLVLRVFSAAYTCIFHWSILHMKEASVSQNNFNFVVLNGKEELYTITCNMANVAWIWAFACCCSPLLTLNR